MNLAVFAWFSLPSFTGSWRIHHMFGLSMPEAYTVIFQTCWLHRNLIIWSVRCICIVIKRQFLPARPQVSAYKQKSEQIAANISLCINTDTVMSILMIKNAVMKGSRMLNMHYSSHHALGDVNRMYNGEGKPHPSMNAQWNLVEFVDQLPFYINVDLLWFSAFSIHFLFPSYQSVTWCHKNEKWCHELLLRRLWLLMTSLARDGSVGIWDVFVQREE